MPPPLLRVSGIVFLVWKTVELAAARLSRYGQPMSSSSIPAILKRLAFLHAVYFHPSSSWWKRWNAKRRLFKTLAEHGQTLLEHIANLETAIQQAEAKVADTRRDAFYTGCMQQEKYDRLMSDWKKTKKGKPPKAPRPN